MRPTQKTLMEMANVIHRQRCWRDSGHNECGPTTPDYNIAEALWWFLR